MAQTVYSLGTLCSFVCAVLLLRGYKQGQQRLLLWSGLCFIGLTLNNVLVFIDLVLVPDVDLHLARWTVTSLALSLQVFGLVWESK